MNNAATIPPTTGKNPIGVYVAPGLTSDFHGAAHVRMPPCSSNAYRGFAMNSAKPPTAEMAANLLNGVVSPTAPNVDMMPLPIKSISWDALSLEFLDSTEEIEEAAQPELDRPYKSQRQGRSHANRLRKAFERARQTQSEPPNRPFRCGDCGGGAEWLVDDPRSGDEICTRCGAVRPKRCLFDVAHPYSYKSKGYEREVHFNVRLRQLQALDPVLPPSLVRVLSEYVFGEVRDGGQPGRRAELEAQFGVPKERWGPKTFRALLKQPPLAQMVAKMQSWGGKRISQHWIQLRKSIGLYPNDCEIDLDVAARMRQRYVCIALAFDRLRSGVRRNMYGLNYIIAQLLRIEEPAAWRQTAMFLPLAKTPRQPDEDNRHWEELLARCRVRFPKTDWPFVAVTESEMDEVFGFFV